MEEGSEKLRSIDSEVSGAEKELESLKLQQEVRQTTQRKYTHTKFCQKVKIIIRKDDARSS